MSRHERKTRNKLVELVKQSRKPPPSTTITLSITLVFDPVDFGYVGTCKEVQAAISYGETRKEALLNILHRQHGGPWTENVTTELDKVLEEG